MLLILITDVYKFSRSVMCLYIIGLSLLFHLGKIRMPH